MASWGIQECRVAKGVISLPLGTPGSCGKECLDVLRPGTEEEVRDLRPPLDTSRGFWVGVHASSPARGSRARSTRPGSPTSSGVEGTRALEQAVPLSLVVVSFLLPASARLRTTRNKNKCPKKEENTRSVCCQGGIHPLVFSPVFYPHPL